MDDYLVKLETRTKTWNLYDIKKPIDCDNNGFIIRKKITMDYQGLVNLSDLLDW